MMPAVIESGAGDNFVILCCNSIAKVWAAAKTLVCDTDVSPSEDKERFVLAGTKIILYDKSKQMKEM